MAKDGGTAVQDETGQAEEVRPMGAGRFVDAELVREPIFLMNRIGSLGSSLTNSRLQGQGFKVRHYSLLSLACEEQAPTQREVAEFLVLDPSQVVALVDDLESQGLLQREQDPRDRRSKILVPTERGRAALAAAKREVEAAAAQCLSALDAQEQRQLQELLAKIGS